MWLTNFTTEQNKPLSGMSIAQVADVRSQHPADALCDLLLEEDLRVTFSYMNADYRNLPRFIAHPLSMAASDAVLLGDHPPHRSYATFVSMLSDYARDEPVLSLVEAVRKMTSLPAQRLGIGDRGIVRTGFKADLVVFDAERVGSKAARVKPWQHPEGIAYVIVNGVVVAEGGERTSATPGRALRSGPGV
jgi:N-acyl-D-amino-acid deacylase